MSSDEPFFSRARRLSATNSLPRASVSSLLDDSLGRTDSSASNMTSSTSTSPTSPTKQQEAERDISPSLGCPTNMPSPKSRQRERLEQQLVVAAVAAAAAEGPTLSRAETESTSNAKTLSSSSSSLSSPDASSAAASSSGAGHVVIIIRALRDIVPTPSMCRFNETSSFSVVLGCGRDFAYTSPALSFKDVEGENNLGIRVPAVPQHGMLRVQVMIRDPNELFAMAILPRDKPQPHQQQQQNELVQVELFRSFAEMHGGAGSRVGVLELEFVEGGGAAAGTCDPAATDTNKRQSSSSSSPSRHGDTPAALVHSSPSPFCSSARAVPDVKELFSDVSSSVSRLRNLIVHSQQQEEPEAAAAQLSVSASDHNEKNGRRRQALLCVGQMCGVFPPVLGEGSNFILAVSLVDAGQSGISTVPEIASMVCSGSLEPVAPFCCLKKHFFCFGGAGGRGEGSNEAHPLRPVGGQCSSLKFVHETPTTLLFEAPPNAVEFIVRGTFTEKDGAEEGDVLLELQERIAFNPLASRNNVCEEICLVDDSFGVAINVTVSVVTSAQRSPSTTSAANTTTLLSPSSSSSRMPHRRSPSPARTITSENSSFSVVESAASANRVVAGALTGVQRAMLQAGEECRFALPVTISQSIVSLGTCRGTAAEEKGKRQVVPCCSIIDAQSGLVAAQLKQQQQQQQQQLGKKQHHLEQNSSSLRTGAAVAASPCGASVHLIGGIEQQPTDDDDKPSSFVTALQALLGPSTSDRVAACCSSNIDIVSVADSVRFRHGRPSNLPHPRAFAAAVFTDAHTIFVCGGMCLPQPEFAAVIPSSRSRRSTPSPSGRERISPQSYRSFFLDDAFLVNVDDGSLAPTPFGLDQRTAAHTATFLHCRNLVVLFGGLVEPRRNAKRVASGETWLRPLASGNPERLVNSSSTNRPAQRFGHSAAVISDTACFSQVVIVGGAMVVEKAVNVDLVEPVSNLAEEEQIWILQLSGYGTSGGALHSDWRRVTVASCPALTSGAEARLLESATRQSAVVFSPAVILPTSNEEEDSALLNRVAAALQHPRSGGFARASEQLNQRIIKEAQQSNGERVSECVLAFRSEYLSFNHIFLLKMLRLVGKPPATLLESPPRQQLTISPAAARRRREYAELMAKYDSLPAQVKHWSRRKM